MNITIDQVPDPSIAGEAPLPAAIVIGLSGVVTVTVALQGTRGPPGPGGGSTFVFDQVVPAANWIIAHNLNRFPSVSVADSSGRLVEGDVDYIDGNTISVGFVGGFAGTAYLN